MKQISIKNIKFLYNNIPSRRKIKVTLTNNVIVYIVPCHESYEQYGGNSDELYITLPIAMKFNGWLHGKDLTNN